MDSPLPPVSASGAVSSPRLDSYGTGLKIAALIRLPPDGFSRPKLATARRREFTERRVAPRSLAGLFSRYFML